MSCHELLRICQNSNVKFTSCPAKADHPDCRQAVWHECDHSCRCSITMQTPIDSPFALSIGSTRICNACRATSTSSSGALLFVSTSTVSLMRSASDGADCMSLISCVHTCANTPFYWQSSQTHAFVFLMHHVHKRLSCTYARRYTVGKKNVLY